MTTYSITMAIKKYEYILSVKSSSKFRRMYKSILFETFIMVEVSVYNPFVFIIPIWDLYRNVTGINDIFSTVYILYVNAIKWFHMH